MVVKMEKIDREKVLERIGNSLITDKFGVLKIEKKDVDKILESKILVFEQKKEILEKIKLLQFFSEGYISYTTPPTRNNVERFLLNAKRILKVNSQPEFEAEITELDKILEFCKDVVLQPFNSTEKKMEQEKYESEVYKKKGKF